MRVRRLIKEKKVRSGLMPEVVVGQSKMVRENKSQKYHQEVLISVMVGKVVIVENLS